ncbi:hypothetical protein CYFUS_004160 [Cystobacter fuscus]|uniref:Uncharacterized protein n=1 Tax=Cystobacter fuscus TaxID=43 RepID=A0A250J436_9BACT|nr:hypothetical protein [Cystobacter fuscus]ATB38725.1 hypothetical protein CYFUS_004160 [Cystobacter fuscus]
MSSKNKYVPEPLPAHSEFTVRPDVLQVSLTVSLETEELAQALPTLQRACEQFQRRLRDTLGTDVTLVLRGARFSRPSRNKLALSEDDSTFVAVDGLLEVPLPAELDFWARGSRLGTLSRLCHDTERDSQLMKKSPHFSFTAVEARLLRPEAHRAELLRRFVTRARELAEAAGSPAAPLHLMDCSVPGPVEQSPLSLEEVGLSLAIRSRLDVVRAREE